MAEKKKRDFEPLPYYRWYWRDYRSSRAVQNMHWQARGLYRELLDECWAKGCIPDDPTLCAEIVDCPAKAMEKHWPELRSLFVPIGDGLLANERLENERTESDKLRVVRAVNGRRGGEKKKQNLANASKDKQTVANDSNLLSSSTSSSEQSKSSSVCRDSETPPPIVACGPSVPRSSGGMVSIGDVIPGFDWRSRIEGGPVS